MYELLDAAGATLCDPLLIILLAVMMMPSGGGSSYVFSGKTDDVGLLLLLKARAAARKIPCAHRRSAQGAQAFIQNGAAAFSSVSARAPVALWSLCGPTARPTRAGAQDLPASGRNGVPSDLARAQ